MEIEVFWALLASTFEGNPRMKIVLQNEGFTRARSSGNDTLLHATNFSQTPLGVE